MRNTNKKGFTVVELVIVIAVIAILAAVLIPTFSGVIASANLSSDQKAVRDMNTVLSVEFASGEPASIKDVVDALDKNGYNVNSLTPLSKDHQFIWNEGTKTIVLVKNGEVVFPKGATLAENHENLASGSSYINVEVDSAEAFMAAILNGSDVTLSADISGVDVTIAAGHDVTIDLNGHTITSKTDAVGMAITNQGNLTITGNGEIKGTYAGVWSNGNITIEGGTFSSTNGFGLIVDNIYGTEASVAVINGGTFAGVGIYNPAVVTINGGTFNVGRDADGATDIINEDGVSLFVSPTFVDAPNTADVTLNGGTFNGDIYVYDDGITETTFVNNGATINGEILTND